MRSPSVFQVSDRHVVPSEKQRASKTILGQISLSCYLPVKISGYAAWR